MTVTCFGAECVAISFSIAASASPGASANCTVMSATVTTDCRPGGGSQASKTIVVRWRAAAGERGLEKPQQPVSAPL